MGEQVDVKFSNLNDDLKTVVEKYNDELAKFIGAKSLEVVESIENGVSAKVEDSEIKVKFVN